MNNYIFQFFNDSLLHSKLDLKSFYFQELVKHDYNVMCFLISQDKSDFIEPIIYKRYDFKPLINLGFSEDNIIIGSIHITDNLPYIIDVDYHDDFLVFSFDLTDYIKSLLNRQNVKTIKKERKKTYVYLMVDYNTTYYKIGRSDNPKFREKTLQSEKPTIELLNKWESFLNTEKKLHDYFDSKRIRGEWFDLSKTDINSIPLLIKKFENE